ncbi:hypothetical protein SEA_BRAYBEAST_44 [Arthrobacter phage BrayBeast]
MSAREDIAALLFVTDNSKAVAPWSEWEHSKNEPRLTEYVYAMADALIAAGYRKPRTITNAEELDALPIKAVIRGKWLAEKWATPESDVWFIAGRNMEWFTDDLVMRGGLPATVLDEAAQ